MDAYKDYIEKKRDIVPITTFTKAEKVARKPPMQPGNEYYTAPMGAEVLELIGVGLVALLFFPITLAILLGYLIWWLVWGYWHPDSHPELEPGYCSFGGGSFFWRNPAGEQWELPRSQVFEAQGRIWHRDGLGQLYWYGADGNWWID